MFPRPEHDSKDEKKDAKGQIDIGKEAAIEAEVRAARERAIVPLEIRMKQFRDMLAEKEVIFCIKPHLYLCVSIKDILYRDVLGTNVNVNVNVTSFS